MASRQPAFATWVAKILELAGEAIVCVDESDRVFFFNRAGEAMFGSDRARAPVRRLAERGPARPRSRLTPLIDAVTSCAAAGAPRAGAPALAF
jgi:PAS domain-containing protein